MGEVSRSSATDGLNERTGFRQAFDRNRRNAQSTRPHLAGRPFGRYGRDHYSDPSRTDWIIDYPIGPFRGLDREKRALKGIRGFKGWPGRSKDDGREHNQGNSRRHNLGCFGSFLEGYQQLLEQAKYRPVITGDREGQASQTHLPSLHHQRTQGVTHGLHEVSHTDESHLG